MGLLKIIDTWISSILHLGNNLNCLADNKSTKIELLWKRWWSRILNAPSKIWHHLHFCYVSYFSPAMKLGLSSTSPKPNPILERQPSPNVQISPYIILSILLFHLFGLYIYLSRCFTWFPIGGYRRTQDITLFTGFRLHFFYLQFSF